MSDEPKTREEERLDIDPDESPFAVPGVEGIPYKKGSREDLAVRRVNEEAEGARERPSASES